jgi:hypothetical protein
MRARPHAYCRHNMFNEFLESHSQITGTLQCDLRDLTWYTSSANGSLQGLRAHQSFSSHRAGTQIISSMKHLTVTPASGSKHASSNITTKQPLVVSRYVRIDLHNSIASCIPVFFIETACMNKPQPPMARRMKIASLRRKFGLSPWLSLALLVSLSA